MTQFNHLLGFWYYADTAESFKEINVAEISSDGTVAHAIGCNVAVSELGTKYKRKDELTSSPYAAVNLDMPKELVSEDDVTEAVTEAVSQPLTTQPNIHTSKPIVSTNHVVGSPEEEMLKAALKLTKVNSVETVSIDVHLSFDKEAIAQLIASFDISTISAKSILGPVVKADIEKAISSILIDRIVKSIVGPFPTEDQIEQ